MHKVRKNLTTLLITAAILLLLAANVYPMASKSDSPGRRLAQLKPTDTGTPNSQNCSHRVGNVFFTITNWGFFGSNFNDQWDELHEDFCFGGSVTEGERAPSFEFPAGSGINYLYAGSIWIGAIVDEDTLVSCGSDGWQRTNEMYPTSIPDGGIVQMSSRKTSPHYSPDAISEQDYIAEYTDTLSDGAYTENDFIDNRPHKPLNVKIVQQSYSWSYSYAEDFVLLDFKIINIGNADIRKAYVAIYIDADIWHNTETEGGFQDDMSGYLFSVPHPACAEYDDSINIAWTADFNGHPGAGGVDANTFNFAMSPTGVSGTRVVRSPNPDLDFSFNWWVSQGDARLDWGPRLQINNRDFGTGGLGTPEGDRNKYYIISQPEFDYDQIWSNVDKTEEGWLPPHATLGEDLADGYDTRYLFSFGPFNISPGDTIPLTLAYLAGEKFHTDPEARRKYWNTADPQAYYNQLNFDDFTTNALWAGWVYDNPGVDTNGDTYAGEKIICPSTGEEVFISGDGVPDFAGPPPPTPPVLRYSSEPGKVTIRWNGYETETEEDPFSFINDFEGYAVYMGENLTLTSFALLTTFDHENYDRFKLNTAFDPARWELDGAPFTREELQKLYFPDFDPNDYPQSDPFVIIHSDGDSTVYSFKTHYYNRSFLGGEGQIRKVYEDADTSELVWDEQLGEFVRAAYEYKYEITGLLPSQSIYLAVTTRDFGNPATGLSPLVSSPLANAVEIYPVNSADRVMQKKLEVAVFPNPYRGDGAYLAAGYEKLTGNATSQDRARRIHFANLPREATIRIYTLDGDLVREFHHPDPRFSEGESMAFWDLITENTQAAVSGIYLYSVESELGNQVGKLVVIK